MYIKKDVVDNSQLCKDNNVNVCGSLDYTLGKFSEGSKTNKVINAEYLATFTTSSTITGNSNYYYIQGLNNSVDGLIVSTNP